MKKYKVIFIVLFFIILIVPICFINIKKDQISKIDNSKLPEISEIDDVETLDNYVSKRIGFRSQIINLYTVLNDKLFHKMIHPSYDYGDNGYVFRKINLELDESEYLDTYASLVKNMQEYVISRGTYFLYVLDPNKKTIEIDKLPIGYHYNDTKVKYLINKFDELEINYIYNANALKDKSKEIPTFNKKYDAGHWNDYGAFYGIKNIFDKLNEDNVIDENISLDEYKIRYVNKESLPTSKFKINEDVPLFTLNRKYYKVKSIKKEILLSKDYNDAFKTINNTKNTNILLFRGSYIIGNDKFISNKFNEVYYIHNYQNAINYDYYYNLANKPEIVIFEGVDYAMDNLYFNEEDMKKKKTNVTYDSLQNLEVNYGNILTVKDLGKLNLKISNTKHYFDLEFTNKKIKYAYLIISNNVYDVSKIDKKFKITLPIELASGENIKLVLIDKKITKKYFIYIN